MHHRPVPEGWLPVVHAPDKTWHPTVSAATGKDPDYLARQTVSLALDGLGREPGSATASLPNFSTEIRPIDLYTAGSSALQLPDASDTEFSFLLCPPWTALP